MFTSKKQKIITYTVFGVYLFLLIWLILFKFSTNPFELDRFRNINLIPFRQSLAVNGKLAVDEIIYNMLVFVPFGVYTAFLLPKQNFLKKASLAFLLSLLFETLQFVFAIGASDITDLLANTLGGIFGIALFHAFQKLFRKNCISVINIVGGIIEAMAFLLLGLLNLVN